MLARLAYALYLGVYLLCVGAAYAAALAVLLMVGLPLLLWFIFGV